MTQRDNEIRAHEHKWVHLSTHYERKERGNGYSVTYTRLDVFFCELCGETKDVKREGQEYLNDPEPIWWNH